MYQDQLFQGKSLSLQSLDDGYVELHFDAEKASVNVFNQSTLSELQQALAILEQQSDIKGLLLSSGKSVLIAGADITEFGDAFKGTEEQRRSFLSPANEAFNQIEALPFPTVVAINGFALGGGFEVCLACDFRAMSSKAQVGLPETKLGIIPGWGGTVRLPRLIGFDNAAKWIATAGHYKAVEALKDGAVDAVVEPELLRDEALAMLARAASGELDYQARRLQKQQPLQLNDTELGMSVATSKAMITAKAGPNYPAPIAAVDVLAKAAKMSRDEALEVEFQAFSDVSQTSQCRALVGIFMNDQYIGSVAKKYGKKGGKEVKHTTALGAGIMGGGIAYQNAMKGFPVLMKDINTDSLALGMSEANKLLAKRVDRGRMSAFEAGNVLSRIMPSLSYDGIENTDIVIEAVVENPKVKSMVLPDVESKLSDNAVLASNTSTISIDYLADFLERPENFCGMHFFNPVHAMPLVEVIRGEKTSDETIATVVSHALSLGKKPIVVNDCPGFLVNRVLFPAVFGFDMMLLDGADFQQVDKVMEAWGWPMGPAYLMDVVGLDTAVHCFPSILEGYPERMSDIYSGDYKVSPTKLLFESERLGQKNGKGYYVYEKDKRGKPKKSVDDSVYDLFKPHLLNDSRLKDSSSFTDDQIVARFMLPMCIELAHCLEEGVVGSPAEADMAVVYGLGFPPFRGGIFRWMDEVGMQAICDMADSHSQLGKLYQPTERMREMASNGESYYS